MKIKLSNIFYILLFVANASLFSQWLGPPYHFQKVDFSSRQNFYGEGHFFSLSRRSLIQLHSDEHYLSEIRITSADLHNRLENNDYTFSKTGVRINENLTVGDFDNDGYDEIIFAYSQNHYLHFALIDPSNNIKYSEISKFRISSEFFNGNIVYSFPDILRKKGVILFDIAEISPEDDNFLRGYFLFSFKKKKVLWTHFTADYISSIKFPVKVIKGKPYLFYFSSSVDNYCFKANKKFYNFEGDNYLHSNIPVDAPDYSTDTLSYFVILDLGNGREIKREKFANITTWVNYYTIFNNDYLLYKNTQNKTDSLDHFGIIKFSLGGFNYKELFTADLRTTNVMNEFVLFKKRDVWYYIDFNKGAKIKKYTRKYIITDDLKIKNKIYYLASSENGDFFLNNKKEIVAVLPSKFFYYRPYLESLDLFQFDIDKSHLYKLVKTPIWNRLSLKTYFSLVIIFSSTIIALLVFWIATMKISRKKIIKQKKEIEETTAKLIQSEKLAVLGTISAGIAHELNSPLGAILNSAERLYRANENLRNEPNLNLILKASKRMKSITNKFLLSTRQDFSSREGSDIRAVIDDWLTLYEKQFKLNGITIETDIKAENKVRITYVEMTQILNNLMTNARDALLDNDAGNEKIIKISAEENNDACLLIVKDTGTGFKDEILNKSFEAFSTTKPAGEGTGLGLWVINQILKQADGKISVENYEKGAIIKLLIPVIK